MPAIKSSSIILTVAESKRLIAKAVIELPEVRVRLKKGMIVIAKGSTNAYVVEEILQKKINLMSYRSGILMPAKPDPDPAKGKHPDMSDVVLQDGHIREDVDRFSAVEEFEPGDIYIKGANAIDYNRQKAGILIGAPNGGTIGSTIGHIIGKRGQLIIPVGLEKLVYADIDELHRKLQNPQSNTWRMFPVTGTIITEIEALKLLCGVSATLAAAGGIAGAEGCVALYLEGEKQQVAQAKQLVSELQGEPRILETAGHSGT